VRFEHEDLSTGDCHDLAASPNGVQRFLTYIETEDGQSQLNVRTGLGNNVWSTSDIELDIPDVTFSDCTHISHLRDNLYGIVWTVDGALHSALFAPDNPEGQELLAGETVEGFSISGSITGISLSFYDDSVMLVWVREDGSRINMMRGQVSDSELSFAGIATFTQVSIASHSNAVAGPDGLYMATADDSDVNLLHTNGSGTDWSVVSSCESNRQIHSTLLYVDQDGDWRTLLSAFSLTNERMLNFSNCSTELFQIPVGRGRRITYSSGT